MGFSENSRAPRDNSPGRQAQQITRGIDLMQCQSRTAATGSNGVATYYDKDEAGDDQEVEGGLGLQERMTSFMTELDKTNGGPDR